ncbi:sensor histidine kinase [Frigidibacter sp. MR17.14]|uniref:sensor histidine kinase n=1 Tax=Frigidibacter sp. MR17.14 TaxID=3126509 RepID=UPI003012A39B
MRKGFGGTGAIRGSIRRRLLTWLLVSTAVIGLLALLDTRAEAVRTANTVSDRVLAGSAMAIAERVSVDETGDGGLSVDIPYSALEMLSSTAQDRVFYRVDGPPGTFITGYRELTPLDGPWDVPVFADAAFDGAPIRVASLRRAASTGIDSIPFVVTVAETTAARGALTSTILLRSALRLGLMILGATVAVWIAVTLALRPLHRLGAALSLRSPDDLSPIDEAAPREVRGLVETVNGFMARLAGALGAMRNFTGNASHQLRTPLAVVRTQLALAARAPDLPAAQAAARAGDAAIGEAERILAQLLTLARVDAAGSAAAGAARFDLVALARDTTAERVPDAAGAGLDLGFEAEGSAEIRAEPVLVAEMLRNLIDNALRYAGRGAEATVRVRPGRGGTVVLEVQDDGPGIPEHRRAEVRARFVRGAPVQADSSGAGGSGLGLPIVEEIATLFGGALELDAGPCGRGLVARIRFPDPTGT